MASVGLESRDWYRRESSRAFWREIDRSIGARAASGRQTHWLVWAAMVVGSVTLLTVFSPHWYRHLRGNGSVQAGHTSFASPLPTLSDLRRDPTKTIDIRWRSQDIAPAPTAGRICITSSIHARICATYVQGEIPADALARQIRGLGFKVNSTG
jgi:hypothetical protein